MLITPKPIREKRIIYAQDKLQFGLIYPMTNVYYHFNEQDKFITETILIIVRVEHNNPFRRAFDSSGLFNVASDTSIT